MARPFTPLQAHENRLFLEALARSGNARMSAREAGRAYGCFQHRRAKHADFAQQWEAAIVSVHARLHLAGGKRGPEAAAAASPSRPPRRTRPTREQRLSGAIRRKLRTEGGEAMVVRSRNGRLQIRLAHPDKLTRAAEQVFLCAVAATANVRLSAAAAGASPAAFYRRRRQNPAFEREFAIALRIGYDRLEHSAAERTLEAIHGPPPVWLARSLANPLPPLSFEQAFQQLCLHRNTVRLDGERPAGGRPRIEPGLPAAMFAIARNIDAIERAALYEETGRWRRPEEAEPPPLPPLERVTGWSKASGRAAHNPAIALFGGWRIGEMERRMRERRAS